MLRRITLAIVICALSTCALASKTVLGKLGQVTEASAIYSRPNSNSKIYYHLKAYEYVVIKPLSQSWLKVLLMNGRFGYIHADAVARLPYQVTAGQPSRSGSRMVASLGSRSTAVAAQRALEYVGTPYVWGGNDPSKGIDCSGLVQQMYGSIGIHLPRTAAEQVKVGAPITRLEDLKAGDRLYFWDAKRNCVGHTGMYLGNGYFVHSSVTHHGVATDYLGAKKWLKILVAARRS